MRRRATWTIAALALLGLALSAQEGREVQAFESLLRRFDTDLDGRVSRAEYPRGRNVFQRLDRDKDGFLTRADFEPEAGDAEPMAGGMGGAAMGTTSVGSPAEIEFFETRVRPLLAKSCHGCHSSSAEKLKGGLRLDTLAGALQGGNSGPAIVPGDPDASALISAVRYTDAELQMPPKQRLTDEEVRDLEQWVASGAAWPATPGSPAANAADELGTAPFGKRAIDIEAGRKHWSFQRPQRSTVPTPARAGWAWNDVDRFLLAAMESKGIAPVGDAERRTWLRRVTFDLTGLPPTPEEIAAFERDRTSDAHAAVVDRLLASPAFGERWGRHWLDVARYGESSGKENNIVYPHAWRYRDWAIAAFNADMPYDRFLAAQLAGDLLPAESDDQRAAQLVATGYLALGVKGHNARDPRKFALDVADEQIDAIGQGMLGVTIACARCHDHKFDPFPTEDYYALAGIMLSSETRYGTMRGPGNNHPAALLDLPAGANVPNGPEMGPAARAVLERLLGTFERQAEPPTPPATGMDGERAKPDPGAKQRARVAKQQVGILTDLLGRFDERGQALPSNRLAMGMAEGKPRDIAVLDRGELDRPRGVTRRGVPQVLSDGPIAIGAGSGRRELAAWVASPQNPLTARVWVNRAWLHMFGAALVATPDNFGASGQAPEHPELLDWLACEFVDRGWSTKALVRTLALSHAYRLASDDDARALTIDPEALTRWRMEDRRLEAEAIRDAMLAAAGTLQLEPPVGSPTGVVEGQPNRQEVISAITRERPVRSVYLPVLRGALPGALEVFDAPDPAFVTGDREETNVATQSLYLMNDPDVIAASDAFATRLLAHEGTEDERIVLAFELALAREPNGNEKQAVREFLRKFPRLANVGPPAEKGDATRPGRKKPAKREPLHAAWSAFAQALFASAEFRYLG